MSNFKKQLKNITCFMLDYDGVLTDGLVYLQADGEALRTAFVRDGYAMYHAIKMGFRVIIISGGYSKSMEHRMERLKATDYYLKVHNKMEVFVEVMKKHKLKKEEVLYMGDDIPDYQVMKEVGLATCPSDAATEIQEISAYISSFKGGRGAVRDIIEQTLKVQGKWFTEDSFEW